MATRPLPQAAAGPRFAPYIEELHEFFATNHVPFGSPADLAPVVDRLREHGPFADDLSSLVRSFILRQGGTMPHAQLLEILTLAIAGHEAVDDPQRYSEPIRRLLAFVAGVLRRPWNLPPGERPDAEITPFPGEAFARQPEPAFNPFEADPEAAAIPEPAAAAPGIIAEPIAPPPAVPTPIHPTPAQPTPLPPLVPDPSPPPSAIAAALAESKRMSLRLEPEPGPHNAPEPVLFLRTADVPRPEPGLDPAFAAGLDRPSPVFRSVLIGATVAAALALFFVFSGRKPAGVLGRIHPFAAFARLEAIVHQPSTPPPGAEHPPAAPSLTVPNPQTANLPPAPQPPVPQPSTDQPPSTQSPAAASTQPAPGTHSFAATSHPPRRSAYSELHHPEPAMTWTYPEANPPTPAPPVIAPAAAAHPAPSARPQPAASTVNPPSNPNQYVPYKPSSTDKSYAPFTPSGDSTQPAAPVVRQPAPQP